MSTDPGFDGPVDLDPLGVSGEFTTAPFTASGPVDLEPMTVDSGAVALDEMDAEGEFDPNPFTADEVDLPVVQLMTPPECCPVVVVTGEAAVNLSGHRAVTRRPDGLIDYASNDDPTHLHAPIWITTGAVSVGAEAELVAYGEMTEASWSWEPGPIYLGADGLLTQTPPAAPGALFLAPIGDATGPTTVFVDRSPSISLI